MTDTPQVLLAHHLKTLKLPTFLREYDKVARQCAAEGVRRGRRKSTQNKLNQWDEAKANLSGGAGPKAGPCDQPVAALGFSRMGGGCRRGSESCAPWKVALAPLLLASLPAHSDQVTAASEFRVAWPIVSASL